MKAKPHSKDLRKGRRSIQGQYYHITKCCNRRKSFLIPDLNNYSIANEIFKTISSSITWLNHKEYINCRNYIMMPDHIHIVFQLGKIRTLGQVMHSFSSFTSNKINKILKRSGHLWQDGFYDHAIRNDAAYIRHIKYIEENPIKAGFVKKSKDWPFSKIEHWMDE